MDHYTIRNSTHPNEIGKSYPQCKGVPSGHTFEWLESTNSMTNLNSREFPTFEPELKFELEENSILTDVISPSNIFAKGLLINNKVKDILRNFNLIDHKYFPAQVIMNGRDYDYYWLHLVKNDYQGLIFGSSEFYLGITPNFKMNEVKIEDENNLQKIVNQNIETSLRVFPSKLTLDSSFSNLDLFFFPIVQNEIIITKALKTAFYAAEVTGLDFFEPKFTISLLDI